MSSLKRYIIVRVVKQRLLLRTCRGTVVFGLGLGSAWVMYVPVPFPLSLPGLILSVLGFPKIKAINQMIFFYDSQRKKSYRIETTSE